MMDEMSWVTRYVTTMTERQVEGNHSWSKMCKAAAINEAMTWWVKQGVTYLFRYVGHTEGRIFECLHGLADKR